MVSKKFAHDISSIYCYERNQLKVLKYSSTVHELQTGACECSTVKHYNISLCAMKCLAGKDAVDRHLKFDSNKVFFFFFLEMSTCCVLDNGPEHTGVPPGFLTRKTTCKTTTTTTN